jgi:hypothetical protein
MSEKDDIASVNLTIRSVEPIYDNSQEGTGYFLVEYAFDNDTKTTAYKLSFVAFVEWLLNIDEALFQYVKGRFKDTGKTISDVVLDLYEIGFDVDTEVENYFDFMKNSIDPKMLMRLMQFFDFLKNFGQDDAENSDL